MTERAASGWGDLFAEGRFPRFALVCLGVWLTAADALVTATIMPSVGADLGGYGYFGWVVAGFLLGCIVAGSSAGWLSERIGLRPAAIMAGLVYAAGCAASAAAPDMVWFLAGRLLQGAGAGWIIGLCYAAIGVLFPERHLARIFASLSAVWGPASLLGPLVGGIFADAGFWRGAFWMFAGQAVVFALAAWFMLPRLDRRCAQQGLPFAQLALIAAGVACIAVADLAGGIVASVLLIVLGLGLLLAVVRVDARARVRLLPRGTGDLRTICSTGYLTIFMLIAGIAGFNVYGATVLQSLHGLSSLAAGYVICTDAAAWTIAALLVTGANEVWGLRWARIGACVVTGGILMLTFVMRDGPLPLIVAAAIVTGAGFGLCWSFISRRIIAALADDERAIGSSAVAAVQQTGGAAGAAIAGAVANLLGFSAGLTQQSASAIAVWVFAIGVPLAAIGVASAWRLTGSAVRASLEAGAATRQDRA
jgi:MFS family permease